MLDYERMTTISVKKINLGSGPTKGENGWTNIDLLDGADLNLDISSGLPMPQDSIEMIYTSHFLEHLDYPTLCRVLKECHRVLRSGCALSICVPDASKFINAYIRNDYQEMTINNNESVKIPSFLAVPGEGVYTKALINTGSAIDWLNYIAYSNSQHKYMFDSENLLRHLNLAGFKGASLRSFDPNLDKISFKQQSIYAVGYK